MNFFRETVGIKLLWHLENIGYSYFYFVVVTPCHMTSSFLTDLCVCTVSLTIGTVLYESVELTLVKLKVYAPS